jgi:predicted acylesterase/phospholipase RssA
MADGECPELRLGLVLYGGVSLAVYIYGVVLEVQRLLRASAGFEASGSSAKVSPAYGDALRLGGLSRASVDIISGTSAGGINGILLAKALATGADVERVRNVWIEEGDIGGLLRGIGDPAPESLLSTEVMEGQLAGGFADLAGAGGAGSEGPLDLFVSSTHLRGDRRLFEDSLGTAIDTLKHRYVFQLKRRPRYERDDFARPPGADPGTTSNDHLVKLSRATSAFPVAFEPVEIARADGLLGSEDEERAWFADGGILNNKPFTEALQTIFSRSSDRPVRRWLLSVDPDPKAVKRPAPPGPKPAFDQIAVSAIAQIPRYQSIAHDLEGLEAHNRAVAGITALVADLELDLSGPDGGPPAGPPSAAYRNMRMRAWAEEIADRLMQAVHPSDPARFSREETRGAFVGAAYAALGGAGWDGDDWAEVPDLAFELRRVYYLVKLLGLAVRRDGGAPGAVSGPDGLDAVRRSLWEAFEAISDSLWQGLARDPIALDLGQTGDSAGRAAALAVERVAEALGRFAEAREEAIRIAGTAVEGVSAVLRHPAPAELGGGETFEVRLDWIFEAFAYRDYRLLPIEAGGGLRHRERVEHAQISPAAATNTEVGAARKLAGDTASHFGGFLDEGWRKNDLLWGRLDAAEILVHAIMAGSSAAERAPLLDAIQQEVLAAELPEALKSGDWRAYLDTHAVGEDTISALPRKRIESLEARAGLVLRGMAHQAAAGATGDPAAPGGQLRRRVLGALDRALKWVSWTLHPWVWKLRRRARESEKATGSPWRQRTTSSRALPGAGRSRGSR